MRTKYIALLIALLVALPAGAVAQNSDSTTLANLETIMDDLQDMITELALRDNLSASQTDALRRELATMYSDLSKLEARLTGIPPGYEREPEENREGVWQRFGNATLSLSPTNARFTGWNSGNKIELSYGDAGVMNLTVTNGYVARWTLRESYSGAVKSTVTTGSGGDINIAVSDNRGSHQFLIKDGGLGPIYVRGGTQLTDPVTPSRDSQRIVQGVWYRAYRDALERNQVSQSRAMDWLIQQYQDNSFVSGVVRDFAVKLGELEGTALSDDPIAWLHYYDNARERSVAIPDPRRAPAAFATVIGTLYGLHQDGDWFDIQVAE